MAINDRFVPQGLTFDDVLLVPSESTVMPAEVDLTTNFGGGITLNIPLISSPMDTVTEARLAIAIAQEGGLGIIHRNLTIARQAEEVDKVKRSESGMILDPITLRPDSHLSEALRLMEKYHISGIPVTADGQPFGKLVGILTNRDIRFEDDETRLVSELMTGDGLVTVPIGTTLDEAKKILHRHRIEKLPIVDDDGRLKGLITVKDIQKRIKYPNAAKDSLGRLRVGAAIGVSKDMIERVTELVRHNVDVLVMDSSHGHAMAVQRAVSNLKEKFPQVVLVAGNVATGAGAEALIRAGADAVRIGVGPGSICTTRVVTGIGVPQLTAVMEAAEVGAKYGVPVIADGGIKYSGDITKALAAGANTVMIGSLFAGVEESPGEVILFKGENFKEYRGMGSLGAMKSGEGARERYHQDDVKDSVKLVPEGIEGRVPYKGALRNLVFQMVGGLRSGMGYVGARNIKELQKAKFMQITSASLRESHPHDIQITKEAPNYEIRNRD
ncbi:MAG: IMP dehydrogenase [Chloroflexi bacterium]|nr:IMP dehydrogenase [Chloroflexota bacterium]OJW02668.1 MAG: IMP dehydrogenase [Chloroflexi bacterium 54-19]